MIQHFFFAEYIFKKIILKNKNYIYRDKISFSELIFYFYFLKNEFSDPPTFGPSLNLGCAS
jgi:hypothetical protein